MRDFGISLFIISVLLLAPSAQGEDLETRDEATQVASVSEMVQSCLEQATLGERDKTSCIGVSVALCVADALTTVEMLSCLGPEITVWESRMDTAFETLNAAYAEQDAYEDPVRALAPRLRIYQEQWTTWRAAKCGFEHEKYRGGSLGRITGADCHLETTAGRTFELEDLAEEAGF